jgi:hypothetical protein
MELDFKDLIGFFDLVSFNEPLDGQECSSDSIVGDRLFIHELIDIHPLEFLLHSIGYEIGEICLEFLENRCIILWKICSSVF